MNRQRHLFELPVAALGATFATVVNEPAAGLLSTPLITLYGQLEERWHDGRSARHGGS